MSKRDHEREVTRRALIKWSLAAGAALGVSRSRVVEILDRTAGRSVAEAAAAVTTKRSLHIRAGNGGLSWFQLLWPHNDIAANAASNSHLAWHAPGNSHLATGTDRPLTIGPDTPFAALPGNRQMTALMAGHAECHTHNPVSVAKALASGSMFAIASVLQAGNPTVIPVISVDDVDVGTAAGSPLPSNAPTGADIVGMFNSAASRTGGLLENTTHADLFRAHYATLAALNRAATRSTTRVAYATSRSAAHFVGTNLAGALASTPTDEAAYGIDANMRPDVADLGRILIVAAKAFQMGLTSSIVLPGLRDDPHGAFADPTGLQQTVSGLKSIFDGFMTDCAAKIDSLSGNALADELVITIEGDTPKTPLENVTWPDATPNGSNWVYIWGGGKLKTGWFGGVYANGSVKGFDSKSGMDLTTYDGDIQAQAAVAAMAYAITDGDLRRVGDFTQIDITGLIAS